MKKKLAMLLLLGMAICFVGCGNQSEDGNVKATEKAKESVAESALEILDKVWTAYGDDEKFAAIGGDMENPVDNAPGKFDHTVTENMDGSLGFPTDSASLIDDCASLIHMMNANTFTGAAYHVTDTTMMEDTVTAIKDNIMNRQWMCGFPETLLVVQVGEDYIVTAFGNGEVLETFKTKLTAEYPKASILVEEAIG